MSTAIQAIKDQLKARSQNMSATVPPTGGRNISTKGKVFTLPDGRTHQGPMTAVILDHRNFNKLYTKPYNPQNPVPPQCFALGSEIATLKPHAEAKEAQADDCASCAHNKWGSDPQGGKGKACKNTLRLAIAPPDASPDDDPMILSVSPSALASYASLIKNLEVAGLHPMQIVTEIDFEPSVSYPKLVFKAAQAHDKLEIFWKLNEKAQSLLDQTPQSD